MHSAMPTAHKIERFGIVSPYHRISFLIEIGSEVLHFTGAELINHQTVFIGLIAIARHTAKGQTASAR